MDCLFHYCFICVFLMMGDSKSVKVNNNKYCFVPGCTNTSGNNPEKVFISVPQNVKRRKLWFNAVRREHKNVSMKTHFDCCEDHFKLEEDMENYMYVKTMKHGKIRLKPGVIPHLFDCQTNRTESHSSKLRRLKSIVDTSLDPMDGNDRDSQEKDNPPHPCSSIELYQTSEKGIQVKLKPSFRSKSTQCSL